MSSVPQYDSIQQQVFEAMSRGDDRDAWLAVKNHKDAASHEATLDLARLRLAIIDLRNDRIPEAELVFDEFIKDIGGNRQWMIAHGYAGLAYVAFQKKDQREAERLYQKARDTNQSLNGEMANLMRDIQRGRRGN